MAIFKITNIKWDEEAFLESLCEEYGEDKVDSIMVAVKKLDRPDCIVVSLAITYGEVKAYIRDIINSNYAYPLIDFDVEKQKEEYFFCKKNYNTLIIF